MSLPRAAEPFVAFAAVLRGSDFPVSPDQTMAFLAGVGLLGPRSVEDIHRAARATLAPPPERFAEFDALFRAHFLGQALAAPASEGDDEEMAVRDQRDGTDEFDIGDPSERGAEATATETLSVRQFSALTEAEALARFARRAPAALPRRLGRRLRPDWRGGRPDLGRALRMAARRDGELIDLPRRWRRPRQRRILLMIDISGSMKSGTDALLALAHATLHTGDRVEVFTFGTRLTRLTRALRLNAREQALTKAAGLAPDWDGGTRIGDALAAFLAVPRFAGFARGALVVVLSDGLERGDPATMVAAVERLSRLAWRLDWLSPLAADPAFRAETGALKACLPFLDQLGDGSGAAPVAAHLLSAGARR
ncbi:MAG: VWA domain-containing protein [Pseudomonadota bacterium]